MLVGLELMIIIMRNDLTIIMMMMMTIENIKWTIGCCISL